MYYVSAKTHLFYSCNLATEPPPLFPFFFFLSIFFTDILSSAILAWSLWQHVTFSLSSEQYSFVRLVFCITGSINLYVYVCLILISLHVIELCLCLYLPSLAPVCDCVCHLALSRYELFIRVYCSYSNNCKAVDPPHPLWLTLSLPLHYPMLHYPMLHYLYVTRIVFIM